MAHDRRKSINSSTEFTNNVEHAGMIKLFGYFLDDPVLDNCLADVFPMSVVFNTIFMHIGTVSSKKSRSCCFIHRLSIFPSEIFFPFPLNFDLYEMK